MTLAVVTGGWWSQGKDALAVFLTHAFPVDSDCPQDIFLGMPVGMAEEGGAESCRKGRRAGWGQRLGSPAEGNKRACVPDAEGAGLGAEQSMGPPCWTPGSVSPPWQSV